MQPIPATTVAIEKLERLGETGVGGTLDRLAERVVELVPDCVGLSLTLVDQGVTLTLVASSPGVLPLDVVQYVDGGPCVEAVESAGRIPNDPVDEGRWSMFARASAAAGVRSTLSLPLVDQGRAVGGINLYAASVEAFRDVVDRLAEDLHAEAAGVVRDADLSFSTRLAAVRAPQILADQATIDLAVGLIARDQGLDRTAAGERLERAAARAGVVVVTAARAVIETRVSQE